MEREREREREHAEKDILVVAALPMFVLSILWSWAVEVSGQTHTRMTVG
jgi:hypothetical protein